MTPIFPTDFLQQVHPVVPGATQWLFHHPNTGVAVISIVGGHGLYGDGVKTFEIFDFREPEPVGYLSVDEINGYLSQRPIELN